MNSLTETNAPKTGFRLERLAAFSDGVIAIAITILVLGLEVPSAHAVPESELNDYLGESLHSIWGFVVSFVLIGTYWLQHYAVFHLLTHATRGLVVLNGLFLMFVSFLPFPTGLQAAYRDNELAMALYGSAQVMCGLSMFALWFYATSNRRLVKATLSPAIVRHMMRGLLIAPSISVLAIGCSFISLALARALLIAIPIAYFSHGVVDFPWQQAGPDNVDETL